LEFSRPDEGDGKVIPAEAGQRAGFVLGDAAFEIIGVASVEVTAVAVEQVGPEGHRPWD